nr:SURF1 family protein [Flexivirga meconopsidis]
MLGLLALAIVLVTAFVIAGFWQWGVAQQRGSKSMDDAESRPVVALNTVLAPQQKFPDDGSLRPVRFTGRYDPAHQVLISGRTLGEQDGFWVVTPVVVDGTGARIPVVRGFTATPAAVAKPSNTQVTVTGALAPGESPSTSEGPPGQLSSVDLASMLTQWGGNIYNGFVFLTGEQPAMKTAGVQAFPPPKPGNTGLNLVNAGYALQWWTFAGFAIFIYFRELRDQAHPERRSTRKNAQNRTASAEPSTPEGSHV